MASVLAPTLRALAQLDDPVFIGGLWRSLVLSLLAFAALLAASAWGVAALAGQDGWLGWVAGLAGGLVAAAAAVWFFVPVAVLIATLYLDRVAAAVDRRFYPALPAPAGAPLTVQAWDALALGLQILALQALTLILAVLLPGLGLVLGWAITGWAIGRGLFVAVAMRRMSRDAALATYRRHRWPVLAQGGLLALAGTIPPLNLLVPVIAVAALTHVLNHQASPPPASRAA